MSGYIAIIDYGMGNLHSVAKAVERLGEVAVVTSEPAKILTADGVILPGVGAFGDAMELIRESGLDATIAHAAASGQPLLGICLGAALKEALGDKRGIKRYASVFVPMDEALAQVVIDISGRPHFELRGEFPAATVGTFTVELVHEFLWKLALESRITLHVIVHYGRNTHHMIEAVFKALGRALDEATTIDPRVQGVPSTKGVL